VIVGLGGGMRCTVGLLVTSIETLILGRVALAAAYSRQTFPWTICWSVRPCVGLSVRQSVGLPSALWKNGGFGIIGRIRMRQVWGSVHRKGYFWGRIWGAPL